MSVVGNGKFADHRAHHLPPQVLRQAAHDHLRRPGDDQGRQEVDGGMTARTGSGPGRPPTRPGCGRQHDGPGVAASGSEDTSGGNWPRRRRGASRLSPPPSRMAARPRPAPAGSPLDDPVPQPAQPDPWAPPTPSRSASHWSRTRGPEPPRHSRRSLRVRTAPTPSTAAAAGTPGPGTAGTWGLRGRPIRSATTGPTGRCRRTSGARPRPSSHQAHSD